MNRNENFRDINHALPHLATLLLDAPEVGSRLGDKTRERTFVGVTLDLPLNREILLPTRKANLAAQIAETMWVLSGRDDVGWLRNYLPRAEDFSDDGARWRGAYGPRLRNWGGWPHQDNAGARGVDQLAHVVRLLSDDPDTRRAVMAIYDPAVDSVPGKDIPCNNWLSFLHRDGVLDLHVAIRSNDLIWGWSGINAFEWSVLLEVVARLVGMEVGSLHFSITSLHIYDRHYKRAVAISEDTPLDPVKDSPRFDCGGLLAFGDNVARWFQIEGWIREGNAEFLSAIDTFPEPMMRSWLRVIAYYWSGDRRYLEPLIGTRLYHAALLTKPKVSQRDPDTDADPFADEVAALHAEKHAAYGDSWKARGELFSILPNIARKVDRLNNGKETSDETIADTAVDLLVYLLKYRRWLNGDFLDEVARVGEDLRRVSHVSDKRDSALILEIRRQFDALLVDVEDRVDENQKAMRVDGLIALAGPLAYRLWALGRNDEPEERMHEAASARWAG